MRFLFAWQHVEPSSQLTGIDGLREVIAQLDGVEAPARAWERDILSARLDRYDASMLDMLCLTGTVSWARLSIAHTQVVGATPVALFLREHADAWLSLRGEDPDPGSGIRDPKNAEPVGSRIPDPGSRVVTLLQSRGALFANEIASACELGEDQLRTVIADLVAAGAISSDGFAGLRAIVGATPGHGSARIQGSAASGRWFLVRDPGSGIRDPKDVEPEGSRIPEPASRPIETLAWTLLRRYGVVFRRLIAREAMDVPWREVARVCRWLEARGEIRGGRFVTGMSGEQFALPDAVERLREIRRTAHDDRLITVSGADPLNLTGIISGSERIRAAASTRIVYRNGTPVAAMEGDMLRMLDDLEPEAAADAAAAAAGRRVPVLNGYVGRLW
jgi:ATP-dependent Lhr-like helicase